MSACTARRRRAQAKLLPKSLRVRRMPTSFDLDAVLSSLDPSRSYDVIAGLGGLIGPLNALEP